MAANDPHALLARFQPVMRYDSQETFFADSAREMTDNAENVLQRRNGALIAKPPPDGPLALEFLGSAIYGDGETQVDGTDQLSDTARDYRDQGRRLHARPAYRNRCYGRAKRDRAGAQWLQYWFFYFYNDYNLAGGLGLHEGDWEMIQLRLGDDGTPECAVYAQHDVAEVRPWANVEKDGDHPVVYPGRGSHASYFECGLHFNGAWFDAADGRRPAPPLTLELLGEDGPPWAVWPGQWGDTEPGIERIESPSPPGPGAHAQWHDPATLLDKARQHGGHRVVRAPAPPDVKLTRAGGRLCVAYDFSELDPATALPERLIVTVNSPDEPDPPATYTLVIDASVSGRIVTRHPLDEHKRYDVHASFVGAGDHKPSGVVSVMLGPAGAAPGWLRMLRQLVHRALANRRAGRR